MAKEMKIFYDLVDVLHLEKKGKLGKCYAGKKKQLITTLDGYLVEIDFERDEITDIQKYGKSVIRKIQPWKFEEVTKNETGT